MTLFCLEAGLQACRCTGDRGQQCLCAGRRATGRELQAAELPLRNPACLPQARAARHLFPRSKTASAELVRQVIEEELQVIHAELGSSEK